MINAIDAHQPLSPAQQLSVSTYIDRLPLAPRQVLPEVLSM